MRVPSAILLLTLAASFSVSLARDICCKACPLGLACGDTCLKNRAEKCTERKGCACDLIPGLRGLSGDGLVDLLAKRCADRTKDDCGKGPDNNGKYCEVFDTGSGKMACREKAVVPSLPEPNSTDNDGILGCNERTKKDCTINYDAKGRECEYVDTGGGQMGCRKKREEGQTDLPATASTRSRNSTTAAPKEDSTNDAPKENSTTAAPEDGITTAAPDDALSCNERTKKDCELTYDAKGRECEFVDTGGGQMGCRKKREDKKPDSTTAPPRKNKDSQKNDSKNSQKKDCPSKELSQGCRAVGKSKSKCTSISFAELAKKGHKFPDITVPKHRYSCTWTRRCGCSAKHEYEERPSAGETTTTSSPKPETDEQEDPPKKKATSQLKTQKRRKL